MQSYEQLALFRFLSGFIGAGFVVGIRMISEWFIILAGIVIATFRISNTFACCSVSDKASWMKGIITTDHRKSA
jgi:nitrate/nitrite transporter NarK